MGSQPDGQLPPSPPQTTEPGPWRFLATLTPISSQMEISAALSGLQVGVSSVSSQGCLIHVEPMDPCLIPWSRGSPDLLSDPQPSVSPKASDPLDTLGSKGVLSPGGLTSLLRLPQGCGEQTMILLAPTLAASRYLDKTEQWSTLPPETKDHAVDLIQKGSGHRGKQARGWERAVQGRGAAQLARREKEGGTCWEWGVWPRVHMVGE